MPVATKSLTASQIGSTEPIQQFLAQFGDKQEIATELLLRLRFIERDWYGEWLKEKVSSEVDVPSAVYAVRKIPSGTDSLWDVDGQSRMRPAQGQGSEDFVASIVANMVRDPGLYLLDHPSIEEMRDRKVKKVLLLDDSIGSGRRVTEYIKRMMKHPTFLSWWSFGWIRITVVAVSRFVEAERKIIASLPGTNDFRRKYPVSTKFRFVGEEVHRRDDLVRRWGPSASSILELCDTEERVPRKYQRGYGKMLSSIVFFHSVPNTIPGVLWYQDDNWKPLFPNRAFPGYLSGMLSNPNVDRNPVGARLDENDTYSDLLKLTKRGVRNETVIALRLAMDSSVVNRHMLRLRSRGLLSADNRITEAGYSYLKSRGFRRDDAVFDKELYIPKTWCAD